MFNLKKGKKLYERFIVQLNIKCCLHQIDRIQIGPKGMVKQKQLYAIQGHKSKFGMPWIVSLVVHVPMRGSEHVIRRSSIASEPNWSILGKSLDLQHKVSLLTKFEKPVDS